MRSVPSSSIIVGSGHLSRSVLHFELRYRSKSFQVQGDFFAHNWVTLIKRGELFTGLQLYVCVVDDIF